MPRRVALRTAGGSHTCTTPKAHLAAQRRRSVARRSARPVCLRMLPARRSPARAHTTRRAPPTSQSTVPHDNTLRVRLPGTQRAPSQSASLTSGLVVDPHCSRSLAGAGSSLPSLPPRPTSPCQSPPPEDAQTLPAFFLISASSKSLRSVAWYSSLMPVSVFLSASFDDA